MKVHVRKHVIIFLLAYLGDGLLEDLAHGVDDDIDLAKVLLDVLEELGHGCGGGEITLVEGDLDRGVFLLQFGFQLRGVILAACGVVVECKVGADAG